MKKQLQAVAAGVGNNRRLFGALSLLAGGCLSAHANLTIVPTFDTTITSDPNAAIIEASINTDIALIDSYIANNTTVTITFQETTSGLGGSSTLHYSPGYGTYYGLLNTAQTLSPFDTTAIASLPNQANNPVDGSGVTLQTSLARALGYANYTGGPDGVISLNTSIMNLSRTGGQNPSFYDLQAVAQHEIDEVLGIGGPGSQLGNTTTGPVGPLDLFRYSAPGVRSFATGTGIAPYFSINGGNNNLVYFNQAGGGSDYSDWGNGIIPAQQAGNTPGQVQDAFGTSGSQPNLGPNELIALDVIGWNLTAAGTAIESVPEPSTVGLAVSGLVGAYFIRRRKA